MTQTQARETNQKSTTQSPHWKQILAWVLQIVQIAAAAAFFLVGGSKLAGTEDMVALFSDIGWGQWFRYLTGVLDIVGAVLLLLPRTAFWGGLLLATIMVGAVFVHLVLIGGSPLLAIGLFCVTAAVAWLRRTLLMT